MRPPRAAVAAVAAVAVAVAITAGAVLVPQATSGPFARESSADASVATAAADTTDLAAAGRARESSTLSTAAAASTTAASAIQGRAEPRPVLLPTPVTLKPGRQRLPSARDVVFIVPHADDESLFAGELIAHYRAEGARIHLVYTTDSAGGADARRWPEFRAARDRVRRRVIAPLGGRVHVRVASLPDGSRVSGAKRRRKTLQFLRQPGVVPAGAVLFAIGGVGNSDHTASYSAARAIALERKQPLYIYWGYGMDGTRLDPKRVGLSVAFTPTRAERGFKRWAVSVYHDLLYKKARYLRAKPQIMGRQGDDVVTVVQ